MKNINGKKGIALLLAVMLGSTVLLSTVSIGSSLIAANTESTEVNDALDAEELEDDAFVVGDVDTSDDMSAVSDDGGDVSEETVAVESEAGVQEVQYVENELVTTVETLEEAELFAETYELELTSYSYGVATYACEDPESVIEQVAEDGDSTSSNVSLNCLYEAYETEETPTSNATTQTEYNFSSQYYLDELGVDSAWETSTGEGVVVAVIDSGIDIDHDEFDGIISEYSYNSYSQTVGIDAVDDDYGHGTHVSGIIAAAVNSDNNIYGIAPDVELLVIKADRPSDNLFELSSLIRGINYAVEQGADIINLSLGSSYDYGEYSAEKIAIQAAVDAGVTVICAAGNESDDHAGYPAAYDSTIAVSALKANYEFDSSYSNYGPEIDIAAQGTNIYSTFNYNNYTTISGTSMACPVVTAVAALIKSLHPEYIPEELENALYAAAQDAGDLGWDEYYGNGVLNAYAAVIGEDTYTITYDLNNDTNTTFESYVAPGQETIEPNDPTGDAVFLGWSLEEHSSDYFEFGNGATEDITLYAQWYGIGSIVGEVTSYNPQNEITITLSQNGTIIDTFIVAGTDGTGECTEEFSFVDLVVGTYQLLIEKEGHTSYSVANITVLDETNNSSANTVQYISLLCGDINEDGFINQSDLNVIWSPSNYNLKVTDALNSECDLNGDGLINQTDLNILWSPTNYNQGSIVIY